MKNQKEEAPEGVTERTIKESEVGKVEESEEKAPERRTQGRIEELEEETPEGGTEGKLKNQK